MNRMKQLIFVIIGLMIASLVIGLMLMSVRSDIKDQVENSSDENVKASSSDTNEYIEQDIVFVSITEKYIMGRRCVGYIIDKNGNKRDYNFAEKGALTPDEVLSEAEKSFDTLKSSSYISETDINALYNLLYRVDKTAKFDAETTNESEDNTTTVYGVVYDNGKASLVKIYSYGNNAETPHDPNAQSIKRFLSQKE